MLRKLMNNSPDFIQKFMDESLINETLLYLRLYSDDREQAISALRIINMLIDDQASQDIIAANKGVESVFIALNANPTDKDIVELAGNILQALDAQNLAKDVKDQYPDMSQNFDPNDDDSIDAIRQANIYLGNLCTAVEEETEEIIADNENVIKALEKIFDENSPIELIASILLLVSRLANTGDSTK